MLFDHSSYRKIKPCIAGKDLQLAALYGRLLDQSQADADQPLRVLDVGTGDGRVLKKALQLQARPAKGKRRCVRVDALEPHPQAKQQILRGPLSLDPTEVRFDVRESTLERFLSEQRQPQYDVILCSHVFYHFPEGYWVDLVEDLLGRLNPAGTLSIALVSKKSWPYQRSVDLGEHSSDQSFPLRRRDRGGFVFAEDLARRLDGGWSSVERHEIAAPLHLGLGGVRGARSSGLAAISRLLRQFLAFMLRTDADPLDEVGDLVLNELLGSRLLRPPMSFDTVFQLRRN